MPSNRDRPTRSCRAAIVLCSVVLLLLWGGVTTGAQPQAVSREKVESALREYILSNGPWKPENLELRMAPFQPISVPAGPLSYRILKPVKGITPGLQNFLLACEVAGKEEARLWIKADIRIFDEVVVTSYPLAHHETITHAHLRLERRDISSLNARGFARIADVEGQQAARAIEVNEILTPKLVGRANLVRRGTQVTLVYESGTLRVEAPGLAHEPGKLGDMIQVKNAASGKLLRGVVLDTRLVRVH